MADSPPLSDPRPEIAAALDVGSALELLETIDSLDPGATGALLVGPRSSPLGTVLLEGGRVCWAVAAGMRRRMTDILRHLTTPALETATVEGAYQRCQAECRPLGEVLVESGLVTPEGMRRALRQHTGEALALLSGALAGAPKQAAFISHKAHRYDARFTFDAAELMVGLGELRTPALVAEAKAVLEEYFDEAGMGAAFVREGGVAEPVPVATLGLGRLRVREILELGRWALSSFDVASVLSPHCELLTVTREDGSAVVAWQAGPVIYAGTVPDSSTLACLIVKRKRSKKVAT